MQLGVGPDQRMTLAREVAERGVLVRPARHGGQGRGNGVERRRSRGRGQDALRDECLEHGARGSTHCPT